MVFSISGFNKWIECSIGYSSDITIRTLQYWVLYIPIGAISFFIGISTQTLTLRIFSASAPHNGHNLIIVSSFKALRTVKNFSVFILSVIGFHGVLTLLNPHLWALSPICTNPPL